MSESDRPPLGAYAYEEIAKQCHEFERSCWDELSELRVGRPFALFGPTPASPSPPKLPEHLRRTIIQYSSVLFRTEAAEYPAAPELELWLSGLVERVIEKVMTIVAKMNQTSFDYIHGKQYLGLSWHGLTLEEMQEAARQGLEDDKAAVLRRLQPDSAQDIVLQDSESGQIIIGESPAQVGGIVERRDKLLEEYKAATGNPSNKQIYDGSMHFTQRARVARETLKGVLYGNCRGHPLTLA